MSQPLEAAHSLALQFHDGQKYGEKDYYAYHIVGVALNVKQFSDDPDAEVVAVLHDILEDTECTVHDLVRAGFPDYVIEAVCYLTKYEGYDEAVYLAAIKSNPLALAVKIADAHFNLTNSIRERRLKGIRKYTNYLRILTGADE